MKCRMSDIRTQLPQFPAVGKQRQLVIRHLARLGKLSVYGMAGIC